MSITGFYAFNTLTFTKIQCVTKAEGYGGSTLIEIDPRINLKEGIGSSYEEILASFNTNLASSYYAVFRIIGENGKFLIQLYSGNPVPANTTVNAILPTNNMSNILARTMPSFTIA